ncbi:MAG: glycosyltransferase family 2 protein [Candidatus Bathyarchaeota archaeon]|nr:glycosyltransferase family 2 protein [Candidatus Bathyarchaeota archaeon]
MITFILEILFIFLSAVIFVYLVRHFVFTLTALRSSWRRKKLNSINSVLCPYFVSIVIPARNEERVIGRLLQRINELTYPKERVEIIAVDDGSSDGTGTIMENFAKTDSRLKVIHQNQEESGRGKASALNAALRHVNGEIVVCFDADYYPQRDILERLLNGFSDPEVGVVQGRVTVLNEPKNIVTRLVALERIGGYRVDQYARQILKLIPQFGGTVGAVRRSLLDHIGGWDESALAEDTDLTFRVYLAGYKVRYINEAECYEEAVESWHAYWRQRRRWAEGHMETAFKHTASVLKNRKLTLREKVDGVLLLNVYFMPILVLFSWIIGFSLFFLGPPQWISAFWFFIPLSFYSFVGNFAPFFEVGIGTYLDGRSRASWLMPLLLFTFLYNVAICTKAFADLCLSKAFGRKQRGWFKTIHFGDGKSYIIN